MNLKILTVAVIIGSFSSNFVSLPLNAQTTPIIMNADDLPNNSDQMKTWSCSLGNQAVLVEEKMVKNWQEIMENWQCREQLVNLPDNVHQFSCESDENQINLITVTWLKGNEGKTQMKNWITAFQEQNMICTVDKTNPFWN